MERDGYKLIFRPCITLPNGKKIWAKWYGKRVFPIWIKIEEKK